MGDIEYGLCDICKEETTLSRKYYYYDIPCDCCNGKKDKHFEIVRHCFLCEPKPPRVISVSLEPVSSR